MEKSTKRTTCRLCGADHFELVLPLLPSAIGDAFLSADKLGEDHGVFPLCTYLCLDCGHLQNLDMVNPNILFGNYTYKTSASLGLVEHFKNYAEGAVRDLNIPAGSLVVEMGSNDGSLLKAFQRLGMRVQGVDAAENIANHASAEGIPTRAAFFSSTLAKSLRADLGAATLFCANNVYAHLDDMDDVTCGIRALLADDGTFIFEVSYVPRMIDNMVFDTIYHEHVSYHALLPLEQFFNRHDLTLFDAIESGSKGGSIRGFAQPLSTGKRAKSARLQGLFAEERDRGIQRPEIYRAYFEAIEAQKQAVLQYLQAAKAEGKRIAAYGASTTTTTLLYHFELGPYLEFIIDDNPIKQGLFSPGQHIPVLPSAALLDKKPDIVVILAWIYSDPIIKRNAEYLAKGGAFLIPLPRMEIAGAP